MAFSLKLLRQIGAGTVRVTFTANPKVVDARAANDALNPDNYQLSGPGDNFVASVSVVDTDRLSVDCHLASALELGTWTLLVSGVVQDDLTALSAPTSLTFMVLSVPAMEVLGQGAANDDAQLVIRRLLNPALKGKGWDSMVAALAAGDQSNWDNSRLAFDQLFLSSAKGVYLDRRASDEGIERPKGVNMSDDLFRRLAIIEKTSKLTQEAILEVLEVFYGRDATRAYSESAPELFALQDNDDLKILLDERQLVTVTFERSHFSRIGLATSVEVAAEITRTLREAGSQGFAVAVTDPIANSDRVRIYSGALGLSSSVRIVGGRGNTALLFPTSIFTQTGISPFATWDVTLSPTTQGNLRFTMAAGTEYDLFQVQEGDLAYIYGDEFEPANTNGTYEIEAVSITFPGPVQWFEIANPIGVAHAGIVQVQFADLMFFRPKRRTIYDSPRHVIVCENGDHLDVVIAATTDVVDRGPGLAAYLNPPNTIPSLSFSAVRRDSVMTIDVGATHNLVAGDQIILDDMLPTGEVPPTASSSPSGNFASPDDNQSGFTFASIQSTSTQTGTYEGVFSRALRMPDKRLLIVGGATTPDSLVFTPKNNITAFEVTSEAVAGNGGREVHFKWTQVSNGGTHGFSGNHFQYRSFGASVLADGRALCTGGANGDDIAGTSTNGWDMLQFVPPNAATQQHGTLPVALASHGQCSLTDNGDALVSGGWTVAGTILATTYRFDVVAQTWAAKASMNISRMNHELVELDSNHVLAIGGNKSATAILNRCEIYNVSGNTWTITGNMTYARIRFGVVKLPDGRVLVLGGRGYNPTRNATSPGTLNSCEIYDPNSGLWMPVPPMRDARERPVVAYLPTENAVYVTGGGGGSFSVEVLDVATMKWRISRAQIQTQHLDPTGGLAADDIFVMMGGTFGNATEKVNHVIAPGADRFYLGAGMNGVHTVASVPDATHIVVDTDEYALGHNYNVSVTGLVTPMKAKPGATGAPGPFSYDPKTGLSITETNFLTDDSFNRGGSYHSVHLVPTLAQPDPATEFPDEEGFVVFNFGFKNQVGPIKYLGRLSDEDLLLDPSVPFSDTLPAGATVRLLRDRLPFEPEPDEQVGNFYVTGTAAGRVAAQRTIDAIVAAGKQILVSVIYPGDYGLGAEGFPQDSNYKLSDKVSVWGGDELDTEIPTARAGL